MIAKIAKTITDFIFVFVKLLKTDQLNVRTSLQLDKYTRNGAHLYTSRKNKKKIVINFCLFNDILFYDDFEVGI